VSSADPYAAPQRLGRYQLLRKIAVGGMAEIYLARVTGAAGFEKNVVVKRILPQLAQSDEFYQMFLDEARIAATLQHPNVVQIYDAQNVGGEHFIAMEYLDGADLLTIRRVLAERRQGLPVQHSVFIVSGVASGLHYAHERRGLDGQALEIVHRDVTPQNVILTREGGIKLVDFGIAKATNRLTTTGFGTLKGKLAYMSPEQCRSEAVDRRSDIYSLGIILFELTTGKRLYRGLSEYEVLKQVIETDVPAPSSLLPGYPADLEQVVMRALARDRAVRYPTALAFHQDLEKFARARGVVGSALALAEFLAPLLEEAERQVEERMQRRMAADEAQGDERGATPPSGRIPRKDVAEPVPTLGDDHTVATPIRRAASTRMASEPSIIEVAPDLSNIRLRRSAFWPIFFLLLLAAGGAAAFYYLRVKPDAAAAAVADAGPTRRPPPEVGGIRVTSQPDGAAVWLRLGRTPLTSIPVDPARSHLVRIEHDGYTVKDVVVEPAAFAAGQAALSIKLEESNGPAPVEEPTALPGAAASASPSPGALPSGRIEITSDPPAADAWLLVAITPGRAGPLSTASPVDLRLAKSGHLPDFATVPPDAFDGSGEAQVSRQLAPRAAPSPP
jgi:tRNA A-37 threonylcarbamoyl transferase component Bud32